MMIRTSSTERPHDPSRDANIVLVLDPLRAPLGLAPRRYGVGFVPEGSEARQITGGPLVPGPWAFTFEKATVIDDGRLPRPTTPEHAVGDGDSIQIDDVLFVVRLRHSRLDIDLAPVISPEALKAWAEEAG